MARIISFATGCVWSWDKSKNRDSLIEFIKNLEVDGVEITFSSKEELYSTHFSAQSLQWIKKLKHITIHAPFDLVQRANGEEEVIKQLEVITRLYKQLNAQNVIIHPQNLPAPEILKKFEIKVSTENLAKKKGRRPMLATLSEILKRYPKIGLCLDVSHAYTWSPSETSKMVQALGNRITQVHFSGTYRKKDHRSLRIVTNRFKKSIQPIFKLSCPIVIEENIAKQNPKFLTEEVEYIKKIFKTYGAN
ncbi:MAG: hypothetical protein NTV62_00435 [Candidatus Gribaldobacteria bacterium]|nr:hypothetical protein [Candidatus Gribaldobacteria bacterium]